MKILYLTWDYEAFLRWLYSQQVDLAEASYGEQLAARGASMFSTMDAYSRGFTALGHQAADIFANNVWMQAAWSREHGLPVPASSAREPQYQASGSRAVHTLKTLLRPYRTLLRPMAGRLGLGPRLDPFLASALRAQIEAFKPDVIVNDSIEVMPGALLREAAPKGCFIIGQHGLDPPKGVDLSPYDLIITMLAWAVEKFRAAGAACEQVQLGFEPSVLDRLPAQPPRDIAVSFIGAIGPNHGQRLRLLEAVAVKFPLQVWGPPLTAVAPNSPLHACYRGEAWGREMYEIMRRSKISLNSHVDAAHGEPANMRLYEATGVGAFLLTDNVSRPETAARFAPGVHLGGYESVEDCVEKIEHYLHEEGARTRIAAAGQAHTLQCHSYRNRAAEILTHLAKYAG